METYFASPATTVTIVDSAAPSGDYWRIHNHADESAIVNNAVDNVVNLRPGGCVDIYKHPGQPITVYSKSPAGLFGKSNRSKWAPFSIWTFAVVVVATPGAEGLWTIESDAPASSFEVRLRANGGAEDTLPRATQYRKPADRALVIVPIDGTVAGRFRHR